MPSPKFVTVAKCLDDKLLEETCEEVSFHFQAPGLPQFWGGFEEGLAVYGLYLASEWRERSGDNSWFEEFQEIRLRVRRHPNRYTRFPRWTLDPAVHLACQEWLMWESPDHYESWFPEVLEPFKKPDFPWERVK